jgi:hypothetical protein
MVSTSRPRLADRHELPKSEVGVSAEHDRPIERLIERQIHRNRQRPFAFSTSRTSEGVRERRRSAVVNDPGITTEMNVDHRRSRQPVMTQGGAELALRIVNEPLRVAAPPILRVTLEHEWRRASPQLSAIRSGCASVRERVALTAGQIERISAEMIE